MKIKEKLGGLKFGFKEEEIIIQNNYNDFYLNFSSNNFHIS